MPIQIHPSADVSGDAQIGDNTKIWHQVQIRQDAKIGDNCSIGKGVYIDTGVQIGNNVKIQNYVSIYRGVTIKDGVFLGPHVCFTNDLYPRAINPDGSLKTSDDWLAGKTLVGYGASLGANSTIRCGTTIGAWAMVGSGSVITRYVPDHGLIWGNPARLKGYICSCGTHLNVDVSAKSIKTECPDCGLVIKVNNSKGLGIEKMELGK